MTYTTHQVCELVGVSYRQLDYWNRQGLVHPSIAEAAGSGSRRRWAPEDLDQVRRLRLASELSQGSLQDILDRLDDLVAELAPSAA